MTRRKKILFALAMLAGQPVVAEENFPASMPPALAQAFKQWDSLGVMLTPPECEVFNDKPIEHCGEHIGELIEMIKQDPDRVNGILKKDTTPEQVDAILKQYAPAIERWRSHAPDGECCGFWLDPKDRKVAIEFLSIGQLLIARVQQQLRYRQYDSAFLAFLDSQNYTGNLMKISRGMTVIGASRLEIEATRILLNMWLPSVVSTKNESAIEWESEYVAKMKLGISDLSDVKQRMARIVYEEFNFDVQGAKAISEICMSCCPENAEDRVNHLTAWVTAMPENHRLIRSQDVLPYWSEILPGIDRDANDFKWTINPLYEAETWRRIALAAFQLIDHRAQHGTFPETFDTPADPFDGKPLRYRREGNGFVLWSVGPTDAGPIEWKWEGKPLVGPPAP